MRKAQADYAAVDKALLSHQRRTLNEYAYVRGAAEWIDEPAACVIAVPLAVENMLTRLSTEGMSERDALLRIASDFDLEIGTLRRQQRRAKQKMVVAARTVAPA